MRCVQRRACPRPLHLNLFPTSTPPLINYVTSFMKKKEQEGRLVDPFSIFQRNLHSALDAVGEYMSNRSSNVKVIAKQCDATQLASKIRQPIDCVITSPPYQTAVDYYRRHQLEMYWLKFTKTQEDRRKMIPQYIGRSTVSDRHPFLNESVALGPTGSKWMNELGHYSKQRVKTFKHYIVAMSKFFAQLEHIITRDGRIVIVIGNNRVNGSLLYQFAVTTPQIIYSRDPIRHSRESGNPLDHPA